MPPHSRGGGDGGTVVGKMTIPTPPDLDDLDDDDDDFDDDFDDGPSFLTSSSPSSNINTDTFEFLLNSIRCGKSLETVARSCVPRVAFSSALSSSSSHTSSRERNGVTLLHAACSRGDARVVQFILDEARKYFLGQKNKNTKKKKPKMNLEEYLMLRDFESGHSAMHRCLFHGPNLTCARVLLRFATEHCSTRSVNLMHQPRCFRGHTPIESLSVMTSATTEEEVEKEKGRRKRRIRRRSDVFAWGSGVNYTLGTGNHKLNTNGGDKCKRIEYFAKRHLNVTSLSCSRFRSFATTKDGEVYSWGLTDWNSYSKNNEDAENNASPSLKREADIFPTRIETFIGGASKKPKIVKVACSENFALLVDDSGGLFIMGKTLGLFSSSLPSSSDACGTNDFSTSNNNKNEEDNNHIQIFPRRVFGDDKRDPISRETFKEQRIIDASCGNVHAIVIDSNGRCWSFGINSTGQLGFQIDASPRVKFPRVIAGIEGECLSVSCSDETTLVLVRKKNNTKAIVRFGSGDCKPKQIRFSSRSAPVSMSCGNSISAFVCETGDLYRFHSTKCDDSEAHKVEEFNSVPFVSCTMTNSRGFVLARNGDCYEFEVNERSGKCSDLKRVLGVKRATSISASDKHALSISNWTEPELIPDKAREEESLQHIACRVVCENVLDLSNCLECLKNLPNLDFESGELLRDYAYEFAALNLDALIEVYDMLSSSHDDEYIDEFVLSGIRERYIGGVELTLGLGWDMEKTYALVVADEEKNKKKKREEMMRERTNQVPVRPPSTKRMALSETLGPSSSPPTSISPSQQQRTSLPPSSSKPIKISLTSTTKYTQKQLQRNSMRMTTPKSVDYKLLSERQKSGDVLRAFKPIIFRQQCEESDEDGNETYDKDLETEAQLKQKLKWKADGRSEEKQETSISRGFTAMSLKEIQESQSRNPLPSFRSMVGSQTKKEFSMEMFETRDVTNKYRENLTSSSATSVKVSLSALARRTQSKKQIIDASPAPWLGSSASFDKNKGGSPSSQQSRLRDLMSQEEKKQKEREASIPIYGFSPNAFSPTSSGSWFPSNDDTQGKTLTLREIQALEEKEKEERELVAMVAEFEKAEKDRNFTRHKSGGRTKQKKAKKKNPIVANELRGQAQSTRTKSDADADDGKNKKKKNKKKKKKGIALEKNSM